MSSQNAHTRQRCMNCGMPAQVIWVHGHGQCAHCKMNVAPCCDGAQACPPTQPAVTER